MRTARSPRLYLLGAPRFECGEQTLDLTAARPIALLAYLALTATPQPREQLLDLLWTESTVEAGRKNLRNVLWALRKTFDETLLQANGDYLALSGHVWVDVHLFEQTTVHCGAARLDALRAAIDLYRGPLLNGVAIDHAPEFELWLMMERERLGQLYVRTLTYLAAAHQKAGDWAAVIALARRGLRYDPLQEPLYRAAMVAYAARGERIEALRQYETLRITLERELGIEPLPETQALRNAIGNGELQPVIVHYPWDEEWTQLPHYQHREGAAWPREPNVHRTHYPVALH